MKGQPKQSRDIADALEIRSRLTSILRGEGEEPVKVSESIRAAELLGKSCGLYGEREQAEEEVSLEDAREELLARLLRRRRA